MYHKLLSGFFCFTLVVGFSACAQTKKSTATKTGEKYLSILGASSQHYYPGAAGSTPRINYRFMVVWKSNTPPISFFWRAQEGWQTCNVTKLQRTAVNDENKDFPYKPSYIQLEKIRKGDTLQLIPATSAKDVAPESIPATITNSIFFSIAENKWLYLPVKNIKELPDVTGH